MKKFIFGILLCAGGFFGAKYFYDKGEDVFKEYDSKIKWAQAKQKSIEFIKLNVNNLTSIDDIEVLENSLKGLPKNEEDLVRVYFDLRKATILFNKAEDFLKKASDLDVALPVSTPPNAPKQLHPLTQEALDKALNLYEEARKIADKYSDGNDVEYNYKLDYLKGEIYFRYLEFLSTPETNAELFNQTVLNYKQALKNKPADIDTVINIEILIKNKNDLVSPPGQTPAAKQKKMLNARVGIGHGSGN